MTHADSPPDDTTLIEAAKVGRSRAYVPYSHFAVGAAVQTASGQVFVGGNIENAAYPLTLCAERVALFSAYAAGEREIVAMAVVTDTSDPAAPCGACRQVMVELAPASTIVLANMHGQMHYTTAHELLPGNFGARQLSETAE
jgi:cytidine deaminase